MADWVVDQAATERLRKSAAPPAAAPVAPVAPVAPAAPATNGWVIDQAATAQLQQQDIAAMEAPLQRLGQQRLEQMDAGIDYSSGASINTRTQLQGADNPREAYRVLDRLYGKGNFGQDRNGQWWVTENGKRVSVLPGGVSGAFSNFGTGMLSAANPTAFGAAGAALGGLAGSVVPGVGTAAGAFGGLMLGSAVGKGVDELTKYMRGTLDATPSEIVGSMATEGALGGATMAAGPVIKRAIAQPIQKGIQYMAGTRGMTPKLRAMSQELSAGREGAGRAYPPLASYAPGSRILQYKSRLGESVSGTTSAKAANIAYMNNRLTSVLKQEGLNNDEIAQITGQVERTERVSTRQGGEAVTARASDIHNQLLIDYESKRAEAAAMLDARTAELREAAKAPPGLVPDLTEQIVTSRQQFGKQMADGFKAIDRMGGNQPSVSYSLIKKAANEIANTYPKGKVPPIIANLVKRKANEFLTFEQAHAMRTAFGEMMETTQKGVQKTGQLYDMAAKMNGVVTAAMKASEKRSSNPGQFKAFMDHERLYEEGIRKYNHAAINRLVSETRAGIYPEPEKFVRLFMTQDNPNLAKAVFDMMPANIKAGIVRADMSSMVETASTYNEAGRYVLDGKTLLDTLNARDKLLRAVYPENMVNELRRHATDLAAFDGRIDATQLGSSSRVVDKLKESVASLRAADVFARENPLGAFVSGKPENVDRALAYITRPGNEAVTEQVRNTLRENSKEWWAVRKYALEDLLSGIFQETKSLGKTISGDAVNRKLATYTKRQQELLFPAGLADDLRLLAKEAKFLFPHMGEEDLGTSLAAAGIKSKLWFNKHAIGQYVYYSVMNWVADHPRVLRYLTDEIKADPVRARGVMSTLGQWILSRQIDGGRPEGPVNDVDVPLEPAMPQTGRETSFEQRYGGTSD